MFLFRTNTSPLGATCVTFGGSLQSALYLEMLFLSVGKVSPLPAAVG